MSAFAKTENKTFSRALVVGANRGLGLAFVERLLEHGIAEQVFAGCRNPANAHALEELRQAHGDRLHILPLSVTCEDSLSEAAEELETKTKSLDLLITCVGVLHDEDGLKPERRLRDVNAANLHKSFAVNAFGPLLVARYFSRFLPRRGHCVVANLSARVGSIGDNRLGGWYAYRASKAAQNMFTRNLSIELRRSARDVVCIALHPGTCDTDLSKPFQRGVPAEKLFSPERAVRQLLDIIVDLESTDNGRFIAWDGRNVPW
ncbi:MAG: SDR family oxidoreductase [Acidobacteriota bacterium]|nr:SDR family oxidoreductase [Acidobacteriota bacterium]